MQLAACGVDASEEEGYGTYVTTFSPESWVSEAMARRWGPSAAKTSAPEPAAEPDASWTTIANEVEKGGIPGTFSLSGTQTVMYGAPGRGWVKMQVTGPGVCSNDFFHGDPAFGAHKVCKAQVSATRAPTNSSGSSGTTRPRTPSTPIPSGLPSASGERVSDTLRVRGRAILDTCGQPFVARGIENFLWQGTDFGPTVETLIEEIGKTNANAIRILPALDSFGGKAVEAVDRMIQTATARGMVVYLSIGVDKRGWFYEPAVKQMLDKHKKWLIVDIFQEATFDDRARWKRETLAAIREFRRAGYTVPVTMMANQGGRDLPVLLNEGAEVAAADTAHNTIFGWQAYWGAKGFYMDHYGMTLEDAIDQISEVDYPVQLGLLQWPDGDDMLDYPGLMAMAEERRIGWLWWDFYLPPNTSNSLSTNGKVDALSAWGRTVVSDDPNSIARTARKACGK